MIVACPVIAALVAGAVSTRLAPVSHEELMAEGGLYSELFNLQARAYLA